MASDPRKYSLNHTMLRIKDPVRSIKYYNMLGMQQIHKITNPDAKFDLYFLAYDSPGSHYAGKHWTARQGLLELTHNYGTETDEHYKVNNGNSDPIKGFGHICINVDNIQAACKRIDAAGYKFQKRLEDGKMRNIAFALDPDNYWVEITGRKPVEQTIDVLETDPNSYKFHHTMIRVKDHRKSLDFYQDIMGMKLMHQLENPAAGFNLYFLGYPEAIGGLVNSLADGVNPLVDRETFLELTWNYGTEKDTEFAYHNGNDEPQGYGHICITVDDMEAACQRFEDKAVTWKKRMTDGRMKNIAFILDPDGYWIEVIQNEGLKTSGDW